MPRKSTVKQTETAPVETPAQVSSQPVPQEPSPVEKPKKRAKKATATESEKTETVVSSVPAETSTVASVSEVSSESETKTRTPPTRESVEAEFASMLTNIDEEIEKHRANTGKTKGVKFLRSMRKNLLNLKTHVLRLVKRPQSSRRNNANSGFLKPVQISKELAKFTGWDQTQLRSRVDVTKFICEYIKEHNLQDPEDKRKIRVDTDPNLKKLLKFDGKDGKPLTYYSLQTYLKNHFTPTVKTV
jgi:upstream activation factor subunit UAF30